MANIGGIEILMKKLAFDQKGFTLIEIVAVLVILGIIAATAIPRYLDLGKDAVIKAASGAAAELNAREKLKLTEWKLKDGQGSYPAPGATGTAGDGGTVNGPDTTLGNDWNNNVSIITGQTITFHNKQVTFTRNAPSDQSHEPWSWTISVTD
jgi:prepilin-type N-terminal cleavage/methylation domain-containing protein